MTYHTKGMVIFMQVLGIINLILGIIFTLCYFYQFVYLFLAYFGKKEKNPESSPHSLAVLVAARNESQVIHKLLESLNSQDYPKERYSVFVVADNCTDNTAEIARGFGAVVYERFDSERRGKGYALDYLIKCVELDFGEKRFDAYIVFDADNVVTPNYLTEMNKTFALGYDVVTSYRNASNYGDNWRSAGQGMFFLRESRVLNLARMRLGANTYVMGTGFLFSREVCRRNGGWPFHLLTEDGEFTMSNVVNGVKTGYSNSAMFYDEQATDSRVCWNQRLRWCKGGIQIWRKYKKELLRGIFSKRSLAFFDMTMCLNAAYMISMVSVLVNVIADAVIIPLGAAEPLGLLVAQTFMVAVVYLMLLAFSLTITVSEWKHIRANGFKKIFYAFTFPIYLFSFVPAAFVAIFKKVEWKQTVHGTGEDGNDTSKN